jgi:hypothetical protein
MERAIIDLELSKLQSLHDNGYIHNDDYNIVETYAEKISNEPEYIEALRVWKLKKADANAAAEAFYKIRKILEKKSDGKT